MTRAFAPLGLLFLVACSAETIDLEGSENDVPPLRTSRGAVDDGHPEVEPTAPGVYVEPIIDPTAIVGLGLGRRHSCAVNGAGELRCWGAGDRGQTGTPGGRTIGDDEHPADVDPVDFGGAKIASVAVGDHHTCALTTEGQVYCFGVGGLGQLGGRHPEDVGVDQPPAAHPPVQLGGRAVQVDAGELHACALLEDGSVVCFGAGAEGRLGYANESNVGDDEHPADVGTIDLGIRAVEIAVGSAHSCARSEDGRVRCWGENGGRLGYGFVEPIGDDEHPADAGDVELGAPAIAIRAGTQHTCALLENGAVSCFGLDAYGELGHGFGATIGDDETPVAARIDFSEPAVEISAGNFRTCARFDTGTIRCIGYPYDGGLGTATTDFARSPRDAEPVGLGVDALHVVSGADHSCAIVEGDRVRCWGSGADGRLGYGMTESVGDDEMPSRYGDLTL